MAWWILSDEDRQEPAISLSEVPSFALPLWQRTSKMCKSRNMVFGGALGDTPAMKEARLFFGSMSPGLG